MSGSVASSMDDGGGAGQQQQQQQIISTPHAHDVLCGRGGVTNFHPGNEWFRRLVKSNRPLYKSCPKHTKLLVARAIVQAVQQQNPPGRFLENANKEKTTWKQIIYKRCVEKTSQALREKDPPTGSMLPDDAKPGTQPLISQEVVALAAEAKKLGKNRGADLSGLAHATLRQAGLDEPVDASPRNNKGEDPERKRKATGSGWSSEQKREKPFSKPPWWGQRIPTFSGYESVQHAYLGSGKSSVISSSAPDNKRQKTEMDEYTPLPLLGPLQARQSSLFAFLNNASGIFGKNDSHDPLETDRNRRSSGFFSFSILPRTFVGQMSTTNPSDLISMETAAVFQGNHTAQSTLYPEVASIPLPQGSLSMTHLNPWPTSGVVQEVDHINNEHSFLASRNVIYGNLKLPPSGIGDAGLDDIPNVNSMNNATEIDKTVPPLSTQLSTQMSDWLISFFPRNNIQQPQEVTPPPPPVDHLERGMSSSFFNLVRSPSQFLTTLRSGVTSMMFGTDELIPISLDQSNYDSGGSCTLMGNASASRPDSLLDDYEETPLETRMRSVISG